MSTEGEKPSGLDYFISEKAPVGVVIFIGEMTKATLGVFDKCRDDLQGRKTKLHVIVFRDVSDVDLNAIAPLVRLQKLLRARGALCVSSIKPELRKFLIEKAAIREAECKNNLTEALDSFKIELAKLKKGSD